MVEKLSLERSIVDTLLEDMWTDGADGTISNFLFGSPGAHDFEKRLGAQVAFGRKGLTAASLLLLRSGPPHFRYLSIEEVSKQLTGFFCDNYWYIANGAFGTRTTRLYSEIVGESAKDAFAEALANSPILRPVLALTLFPIVPVRVQVDFESSPFFLIAAESLSSRSFQQHHRQYSIFPTKFPPLSDWQGKSEQVQTWLGVNSPAISSSMKVRAIILAGLALTQSSRMRHLCSLRSTFGGHCTISGTTSISFGDAHTPGLAEDIVVTNADHQWLSLLSKKFNDNRLDVRRQLRALQLFYRAWFLDPQERFPILCMTLDAIFGEANHAAKAVIDAIRRHLGSHLSEGRLRLLLDLRAAVIHGGAPDVYESSNYRKYFDQYTEDPIVDLELVVAACLRKRVFSDSMAEHLDPYEKLFDELKKTEQYKQRAIRSPILGADGCN